LILERLDQSDWDDWADESDVAIATELRALWAIRNAAELWRNAPPQSMSDMEAQAELCAALDAYNEGQGE
jgi:hypothetical protein